MSSLYEELMQYQSKNLYPFHMPGHKRNPAFSMENPYSFDVTEVEGTGHLFGASGIIKEAEMRAKRAYGSRETKFLVGGSTSGILSAISACVCLGDKILIARNCHKSVYHAIFTMNLKPYYIYPDLMEPSGIFSGVTREEVERAWERTPDIKCVVVTSPTYEGIVSEVKGIADFLHEKGVLLIVDEAHGAHLRWHKTFPVSALEAGADIIIQSLHKTLPALTPAALLHIGTDRVPLNKLSRSLQIYQTSSPSYVLMSSMDQCIGWLAVDGKEAFERFHRCCAAFYKKTERLVHLSLLHNPNKDYSKIIIKTDQTNITGYGLGRLLREEYHMETEMQHLYYVTAIAGAADTEEALTRLADALLTIDRELKPVYAKTSIRKQEAPESCYTPYEADLCPGEQTEWKDAPGRISKEFVAVYPPGIPCIVPGEVITAEILQRLTELRKSGGVLQGLADGSGRRIEVAAE